MEYALAKECSPSKRNYTHGGGDLRAAFSAHELIQIRYTAT